MGPCRPLHCAIRLNIIDRRLQNTFKGLKSNGFSFAVAELKCICLIPISYRNLDDATTRKWRVSANDEDFEYFSRFVETIANLTLDKIYGIFEYGEDERLRDLDLRELVEFVCKTIVFNFRFQRRIQSKVVYIFRCIQSMIMWCDRLTNHFHLIRILFSANVECAMLLMHPSAKF